MERSRNLSPKQSNSYAPRPASCNSARSWVCSTSPASPSQNFLPSKLHSLTFSKKTVCNVDRRRTFQHSTNSSAQRSLRQFCSLSTPPSANSKSLLTRRTLGVGATLKQKSRVVAYRIRKQQGDELRYPTHEKEIQSIFTFSRKWLFYLEGTYTIVYTDNKSLRYFDPSNDLSSRMTRWNAYMARLDYEIRYLPGTDNIVADVLSRQPMIASIVYSSWDEQIWTKLFTCKYSPDTLPNTPRNGFCNFTLTESSTSFTISFLIQQPPTLSFYGSLQSYVVSSLRDDMTSWVTKALKACSRIVEKTFGGLK